MCILQHSPWGMIICHSRVMFMPAFYPTQQAEIKVCNWSTAIIKRAFSSPTLSIFPYNHVWNASNVWSLSISSCNKQKYLSDTRAILIHYTFSGILTKVLVEYILWVRFSSFSFSYLRLGALPKLVTKAAFVVRGQEYLSFCLWMGIGLLLLEKINNLLLLLASI